MEEQMKKGSELFGVLKAILIGLVLEAIYFIVGDLVIGEFMPLADDLGYVFFIWYLGLVYFIWIPASIIVLIYKHKKEKQAAHKGVYSHEEDNHYGF